VQRPVTASSVSRSLSWTDVDEVTTSSRHGAYRPHMHSAHGTEGMYNPRTRSTSESFVYPPRDDIRGQNYPHHHGTASMAYMPPQARLHPGAPSAIPPPTKRPVSAGPRGRRGSLFAAGGKSKVHPVDAGEGGLVGPGEDDDKKFCSRYLDLYLADIFVHTRLITCVFRSEIFAFDPCSHIENILNFLSCTWAYYDTYHAIVTEQTIIAHRTYYK